MNKNKYKLDIQNFASLLEAIKELSEPEMLNFSNQVQLTPMLGDRLFPDRKNDNLKMRFVKNQNLVSKSAHIHAFDTKGHMMSRDGFQTFEFSKILIKEQMSINEELMMALSAPRSVAEYNEVLRQIFDDATNLMNTVKVRVERMKMDALAYGKIEVDENNAKFVIDYEVPAEHKATLTSTNAWSDTTNSNPIEDIQKWADKINEDTGITPTRALTSTKVLRLLQANKNIQLAINGENYASKLITKQDLNNFMDMMGLPRIDVYDKKYRLEKEDGSIVQNRYFPEDMFVMFPDGNLGNGEYGPTPTEVRRVKKTADDIPYGNIYVTVREEVDPVATITKAEGLCVPSFPTSDQVFQAKVLED